MVLGRSDPLERIAVCLEDFIAEAKKNFIEEDDDKENEDYKLKYMDLWKKHQEVLRQLTEGDKG